MHLDRDRDRAVLVLGPGRELPVARYDINSYTYGPNDEYQHHTRQAIVAFENRWALSIIWGTATYSSNRDTMLGRDWMGNPAAPFTDEPTMVEVGILMPEPVVVPAMRFGPLPSGEIHELPEHLVSLWGDPLGYVDAEALWWLAVDEVSRWPGENRPMPDDGPYLHAASETGPFMLTVDEYAEEV